MMQKIVDLYNQVFDWFIAVKESFLRIFLKDLTWLSPDAWCYLRMMLAIPIVFLARQGYVIWAVALFIFALLTDLIDGAHARASNQVSEDGAKLDANADKILIGGVLIGIGFGKVGLTVMVLVLSFEGLLFFTANFLKPFLLPRGYPLKVGSNRLGKTKMVIQSFAVGLLLITTYSPIIVIICEYLLWIAMAFSIGSLLLHLGRMEKYHKNEETGEDDKSKPIILNPKKRIITTANLITLSAIFLFVPAGMALIKGYYNLATGIIFWIVASDWVDGFVARRYKQVTEFGAALDPIRDNIARGLLAIWLFYRLDSLTIQFMLVALFVLESVIGIICVYMAKKYKTVNLVNSWGKTRAVVHYFLITIPYFQSIGWLTISENWHIANFSVMMLFSIIALVSYLSQRVNFVVEEIQKKP